MNQKIFDSRYLLGFIPSVNGRVDPPILSVVYGSRKDGSDIDLFLIYQDEPLEKAQIKDGIDCLQNGIKDFFNRFSSRDIELTEPIINGEYLQGNREIFEWAKNFLDISEVSQKNITYLKERSLESYLQANLFRDMGINEHFSEQAIKTPLEDGVIDVLGEQTRFNNFNIYRGLGILTYCLSYLTSSKRYEEGAKKVTLKDMIQNPVNDEEKTLKTLRIYYKERGKSFGPISNEELDYFYSAAKSFLRKGGSH